MPCGRENYSKKKNFIHNLDARVKLITCMLSIVLLVNIYSAKVLTVAVAVILFSLLAARVSLKTIVGRAAITLFFIGGILLFLPFTHGKTTWVISWVGIALPVSLEGLVLAGTLALRTLSAILLMVFLTETTTRAELLSAIKQLPVPPVFSQLIDFTWRYFMVIKSELQRMQRAQKARGYVMKAYFNLQTLKIVSQTIGAMFMRSYSRAERVHWAMLSRAYGARDWTYKMHNNRARIEDYVWGISFLAIVLILLMWDKGGSQWIQLLK